MILCRIVFDTAVLYLWGSSTYLAFLVSPPLSLTLQARLRRVSALAAAAAISATLMFLPLRGALIGGDWQSAADIELLLTIVTETNIGTSWLLQVAGCIILVAALSLANPRLRLLGGAAAGLLLIVSVSLTGHAVMNDGWVRYLHQANNILHMIAAGGWIGALPAVYLLLRGMRNEPAGRQSASALMRYSTMGHVAVLAVLVSGAVNSALILGPQILDVASTYQRLLLLKVIAVAVMVGIAVFNRYVLVPRLRAPGNALAGLRAGTVVEIVTALVVIALVAWFGTIEPA